MELVMEYKDVSAEIAGLSQNYASHKLPSWWLRLQELWQQFLQWLQYFLNNLFERKGYGPADNTALSTLMQYGIYLAGALALIVICILLYRRATVTRPQKSLSRRGAVVVEKILDAQGYRQESEVLSGGGDFKGACRALYLCLLQYMHEKNVAVFSPASTNREYSRLLAPFGQLQVTFRQFADIVEQLWFGNRSAVPDDYGQCCSLLDEACREVERISAEKSRVKMDREQL